MEYPSEVIVDPESADEHPEPRSAWLEVLGWGVKENYYEVGGIRTRVLEAGVGSPLILLHGTGGHAETYLRNIGPLSEHFHVYALDMVGHGFTDHPDLEYTMDNFADHVRGFLDVIGADSAFLSGESLGGGVACWLALRHPERVRALALNTGLLARPDAKGLKQLADLEERTRKLGNAMSADTIRARLEWLVLDPSTMTDEMVQVRLRIYSQPGMAQTQLKVMSTMLAMNRSSYGDVDYYSHSLEKLQCPALVLWTDHNPGKSYEAVRHVIESIPVREVHMLQGAAHWPQWEKPATVNRLMIDFLQRMESGPAQS